MAGERLRYLGEHASDWRRFWDSDERQEEIAGIERDGRWCTHVCFIHSSLKVSRKAQVVDVPLAYLSR